MIAQRQKYQYYRYKPFLHDMFQLRSVVFVFSLVMTIVIRVRPYLGVDLKRVQDEYVFSKLNSACKAVMLTQFAMISFSVDVYTYIIILGCPRS